MIIPQDGKTAKVVALLQQQAKTLAQDYGYRVTPSLGEMIYLTEVEEDEVPAIQELALRLVTNAQPSFSHSYYKNLEVRTELIENLEGCKALLIVLNDDQVQILSTSNWLGLQELWRHLSSIHNHQNFAGQALEAFRATGDCRSVNYTNQV